METKNIKRQFKSGQSAIDHCRSCKGLLYEDEEDNSICETCLMNQLHDIVNSNIRDFLRRD